jgi:hypothetical protein
VSGPIRARKRPLEVEAWPYDGTNAEPIVAWAGPRNAYVTLRGELIIRTPEGDHAAEPGDTVIRGLVGELYPVKPNAWAAGYDVLGPA